MSLQNKTKINFRNKYNFIKEDAPQLIFLVVATTFFKEFKTLRSNFKLSRAYTDEKK
jgi:hypothetical protein